jgi:hypothetical protein
MHCNKVNVPVVNHCYHVCMTTLLLEMLVVIYLTCTMGLGTASVCMTVLVLNLHHRDVERPVPRWARVIVLRHLARLLCVGARKPKTMAVTLQNTTPDGGDSNDVTAGLKDGLRQVSCCCCCCCSMTLFLIRLNDGR